MRYRCETCGGTFDGWPSKNRRYCSRACYGKTISGARNVNWRGGTFLRPDGYRMTLARDHPHAVNGYVFEHRLVAETAMGKTLRRSAQVHHIDGNPSNNNRSNLVVCESQAYHKLLHTRSRIRSAGGNPNTDGICSRCRTLKPMTAFGSDPYLCLECGRVKASAYRQQIRDAKVG